MALTTVGEPETIDGEEKYSPDLERRVDRPAVESVATSENIHLKNSLCTNILVVGENACEILYEYSFTDIPIPQTTPTRPPPIYIRL